MSKRKDGGSAFPHVPTQWGDGSAVWGDSGLSIRNYMAAKALPAVLEQKDIHNGDEWANAAWISYQIADAMLSARKEPQQ